MYLWGEVTVWEKSWAVSKRRNFLWSGKMAYEDAFQNLRKSCLSFGGFLCMARGVRERRSSIVKYEKMSYRSRLVKILCDPPRMDSYGNFWIHLGEDLVHDWSDFVTELQKCALLISPNVIISLSRSKNKMMRLQSALG